MKHALTALVICLGTAAVTPAMAAPKGCPPGLAKKDPACVPPGLAKQSDRHDGSRYRVGDRIEGDYIVIRNPDRWGLDPRYTYYRIDDEIFRIDSDTRRVLDFIGLAAALLGN